MKGAKNRSGCGKNGAPALFLLFVFAVYLFTFPALFSEAEDALSYILQLSTGEWSPRLINPNHLIFNALNYLLCELGGLLSLPCLSTLYGFYLLISLLNLSLCYRISRILNFSLDKSLFFMGSVAFSFGYWFYSLQIETYIAPVLFNLLLYLQLLPLFKERGDPIEVPGYMRRLLLAGLFTALAVISHQQQLLMVPVVLLLLTLMGYSPFASAGYLVAAGLPLLISYSFAAIALFGASSVEGIIHFSKGVANFYEEPPLSPLTIVKSFGALFKAIWGGYFLFRSELFISLTSGIFSSKVLIEELFLGEKLPYSLLFLSLPLLAVSAASLLYLALSSLFPRGAPPSGEGESYKKRRYTEIYSALSLAIFFTFNSFWDPFNIEFYIAALPLFFLLLTSRLSRCKNRFSIVGCEALFVASLFSLNLFGNMLPMRELSNDFWYQNIELYRDLPRGRGALIILGISDSRKRGSALNYLLKNYADYYGVGEKSDLLFFSNPNIEEIIAAIEENREKKIYLSSWLFGFPSNGPKASLSDAEIASLRKKFSEAGIPLSIAKRGESQLIFEVGDE